MHTEAQIDSKAFEEIIEDFVEVHKAASHEVDVGVILSDIKITIQASQQKYSDFLSSFALSCANAKAKLDKFIKGLDSTLDESKHLVANTWDKQLSTGRAGIKEATTNIEAIKVKLEKINKDMTNIVIQYHAGVTETDNKLNVVKQLRDIIEDELINPTGKSFIQVGKFTEKLKSLEELVKKSGDSLYTPIIQTLVELASKQNFSDQKILNTILKNLKALEDNLRKFKKEKEFDLNVTLKTLNAQEENLTSQLIDYHHLEQRYTSDVQEAAQNIDSLNSMILNLNMEIARKQDESRHLDHLCDTENAVFKNSKQRVDAIRKNVNDAMNTHMKLHS